MALNYHQLMRLNEDEARTYFEKVRWPKGPVCPDCKTQNIVVLKGRQVRPGVYRCKDCRRQFTVTIGTIMERSHIPLSKWIVGIYRMCSSKKGVSALQLKRELWGEGKGSYQTAWFMAHRIREAMKETGGRKLYQTVQADEAYIGGKAKWGSRVKKAPIMVLVEQGKKGRSRAFPIKDATTSTLQAALIEHVADSAAIHTDEALGYLRTEEYFSGGHKAINHSHLEYVRKVKSGPVGGRPITVTTNTAESWIALFKRGLHGAFHSVSKKHLGRYCVEFAFRWSHRTITDAERTIQLILGCEGRRLTYKATKA